MKKMIVNRLTALLLLLTVSLVSAQHGAHDELEIDRSFKAKPGGTLEIKTNPGEIEIRTWEKNEVQFHIVGIESEEGDAIKFSERDGTILVDYSSDWNWSDDVTFKVYVPVEFNLSLKTTGGEVTVKDNISGNVRINTGGGEVDVKNIDGNASLYSAGGEINGGDITGLADVTTMGGEIKLGSLTGPKANIKTMGGEIKLKSVSAELNLQTYGGDIKLGDLYKAAALKTYGGDVSVTNAAEGVEAVTYGGNIKVTKAAEYVKAKTNGGNIIIRQLKGYAVANTSAGRITVALHPTDTKKESTLKSGSGDVTLYLPADAKVTVRATIRIHGWWGDDEPEYDAYCEFGAEDQETKNQSSLEKVFKINGGGHIVNMKATNSDIKIKKIK